VKGPASAVSVIVPTFNEAQNLPELVKRICASLPEVSVIVVDDDSKDGTADVGPGTGEEPAGGRHRAPGREGPVHRRAPRAGRGGARISASSWMPISVIPPNRSPGWSRRCWTARDIAVGSRYVRGGDIEEWPLFRRFTSWAGTLLARPLTAGPGPRWPDSSASAAACWTASRSSRGVFKILLEILARTGNEGRRRRFPSGSRTGPRAPASSGRRSAASIFSRSGTCYGDLNPWPLKAAKFLATGALGLIPFFAVHEPGFETGRTTRRGHGGRLVCGG